LPYSRHVADQAPHAQRVADDVEPADARAAAARRSSVARIRIVVVLPAPFGPMKPQIEVEA